MVVSMAPAAGYAVALDLCPLDTAAPLGIALIVPSKRTLLMMADGAGIASVAMPDETWREIDAWIAEGNARLPKQPPPLAPSIVAAFLGAQSSDVRAQRFAAIPIVEGSHYELTRLTASLPGLLIARRSAA